MKTVHKETLEGPLHKAMMPEGSQILIAHHQHLQPTIWYLCDPSRSPVERKFRVYGTGHEIPGDVDASQYIGTAFCASMVWHIFEEL